MEQSSPLPVKEAMLRILAAKAAGYSELVRETGRPDKTIFVNLRALRENAFIKKTGEKYTITESGRRELQRRNLQRLVDIWAELKLDISGRIAQMWDQEYLWKMWVDTAAPRYEGIFPSGCDVVREFGTRCNYKLVNWKKRLWEFSLGSFRGEPERWTADTFRVGVAERTAELCVEADALLSAA